MAGNSIASFLHGLTGPAIHIVFPLGLSILIGLNPVIAVFCGILPDMVDKPLSLLGIGGGRFIGHTLLFGLAVVILFFIWKRKYGFSALLGITSHFVLDLGYFVPWFYPFKQYVFPHERLGIIEYLKTYFSLKELGFEIIAGILVLGLAIIFRRLISTYFNNRR